MSERTIPAPNVHDENLVARATMEVMNRNGVPLGSLDENVVNAITEIMEVQAQQVAEIRWLRNMIHPK